MDTYAESLGNAPLEAENVMVLKNGPIFLMLLPSQLLSTLLKFGNGQVKSSLRMDYESHHEMSLINLKGARSKIAYLLPDMPNNGLGLKHAIDGNQDHEFNF